MAALYCESVPSSIRHRAYTIALRVFRRLPAPVRRGLVRAGTPSFTVGAVALIQVEGRVLFLRQPHRPGWSLPGGLLDRGEEAVTAVVREVREETGLRIEVGLPSTCLVSGRARRVDVIFEVTMSERPRVAPGGEAEDFAWLSPHEVDVADDATREILAAVAETRRASDVATTGEDPS